MRLFKTSFLILPVLLLLLGWFGFLHPALDSLAVFRGAFIWLLIIALPVIFKRSKLAFMISLGLVVVSWLSMNPSRWQQADILSNPLVVYQKNLLAVANSYDPIVQDIIAHDPDFVMLQEVSRERTAELQKLDQYFAEKRVCFGRTFGVAVYSKWPLMPGSEECTSWLGYMAAKTKVNDRELWVMAQHLRWPWPYPQPTTVAAIKDRLTKFDAPLIVAGDFNHVAWSHAVQDYSEYFSVRRIGKVWKSFQLVPWVFGIPIDHVLVSDDLHGHTEPRPFFGSDHRGLVARIEFVK